MFAQQNGFLRSIESIPWWNNHFPGGFSEKQKPLVDAVESQNRTGDSPTSFSLVNDLNERGSSILDQEWYPCTHGKTIREYMNEEGAGPFLQLLHGKWVSIGNPPLESIQEMKGPQDLIQLQCSKSAYS